MLVGVGVAAASVGATGSAAAQSTTSAPEWETIDVNYESSLVHDPHIPGTVDVSEHPPGADPLSYVADDGETAMLSDEGIVLSEEPDDDETPHNPVSIRASDLYQEDEDGNRVPLDEFAAFPRGAMYDESGDGDADTEVSALDATHWSVDSSTSSGTLSVTDSANDSLNIAVGSQSSGDVATATLDLSTIASEDATITSGIARKFVQVVADVDVLASGALVEVALVDSSGAEVAFTVDPAGDATTEQVLMTSTGDAQVGQGRVGEVGDISDIEQVEVRIRDAAADLTLHGLNIERESMWVFGSQETQTTDDDGNTIVESVDVTEPSGWVSIESLDSMPAPFGGVGIAKVRYDVEMRASELPDEQVLARVKETPDTYDRPWQVEVVPIFMAPTAYSLSTTFERVLVEPTLPQGRYLGAEVATGISDPEDFGDLDGVSWTSRTSSYSAVGEEVELLSTVASSDVTAVRHRYTLSEDEASSIEDSGSSGVVVVGGDGGSGGSLWATLGLGGAVGFLALFRKQIMALFGK